MRVAGSSSWRVEEKGSYLAQLALFVRDAVGLDVPADPGQVPPLTGQIPDLASAMSPNEHRAAAREWPRWWRDIVDLELGHRSVDDPADHRRRIIERAAVCDPPDFAALAERPGLRAAARACFESFRQWESARRTPPRTGLSGPGLDWTLMKQTAEDVAFDHQVSLDDVQASLLILAVQGLWWHRVAPGAVLCSTAATADKQTSQVLLHDAFGSHVAGRP